jgi:hypothetical protein
VYNIIESSCDENIKKEKKRKRRTTKNSIYKKPKPFLPELFGD